MSSRVPTPSKIILNAAASGDVVAALAGKRIRVYAAQMVASAAATAQFRTGAAGTVLTGAMSMIAGTPLPFSYNEKGWFETDVAGQALQLVIVGVSQISGVIAYEYVS